VDAFAKMRVRAVAYLFKISKKMLFSWLERRIVEQFCTGLGNPTSNRNVANASIPPDENETPPPESEGINRRSAQRIPVTWSVDCETDETFLYAAITNISALGIFVHTVQPLSIGTHLLMRFAPPGMGAFALQGQVQWVNPMLALGDNPNPGMGVQFIDLAREDRERLVEAIRVIAYVRDRSA